MASATEEVYVKGKVKWFRAVVPESQYETPRWSHVLYPDTESLEIIRDLQAQGAKNQLKKDDDNQYYVRISRPVEIRKRDGTKRAMFPPKVIDKEGNLFEGNVGNGSDVTTKLEVYSHNVPNSRNKAKAMRWLSSRIDNLVPFEQENDFTPEEQASIKGLDKQEPSRDLF